MHLLPAEPRSTSGLSFPSQCPCGTILLTLYSMVWDWRVSCAGPILFCWPKLFYPFLSSAIFPFLFFSVNMLVLFGWGRTDRVDHPPLPTTFNDNNKSTKYLCLGFNVPNFYMWYPKYWKLTHGKTSAMARHQSWQDISRGKTSVMARHQPW